MEFFKSKVEVDADKKIAVSDMILTTDMPTSAGSKMLDGYMSLFEAEAVTRLKNAGYGVSGKAKVGEFDFDLLGESSFGGALYSDGKLLCPSAEAVKSGEVISCVGLDVNGSIRRAAAQYGMVGVKPTYGTVSRYGTIPVACSGECVSVLSNNADVCADMLDVMAGHDNKDGTSLSDELCNNLKKDARFAPIKKVAILKSMLCGLDDEAKAKIEECKKVLSDSGIEVREIDDNIICKSKTAWNILMSAELCNNVSRYDGVKYGYRAEKFSNIDELYTNSRTEAFGELLKTAILFGSETLSTDNYMKVYDKALRTRRVICEEFAKIFESFDACLLPACSSMSYSEQLIKDNKHIAYEENYYTAPASVTGLPAVVCGGVQLVGKAFSEKAMLEIAKLF